MRIPGARRARLIIFISLAALAVAVGWLLTARARALYRNIGPLLVTEMERQLGREVTIGRVDASRLGRVVLEDIAVAEEDRLAAGALFRARRITLRYSWLDLLWFRTDVAGSVRRVEIDQPYLLVVRGKTGRLNLQDLFKPRPDAPPTRFRALVLVTGGRLVFRDFGASLPRLPAQNEIAGLDGRFDYRTYPRITAQASGAVRGDRAGNIQANTWIDTDSGRFLLRSYASDADAAYWFAYLLRTPAVRVQRGRANVDLVVSRAGDRAPLEYVVNLAAAGVGARVAQLAAPLQAAEGVAQITPYGVKLEAAGTVAGMGVQVSGNILDWKQPQVALSARGSGLTLARLRRILPDVPPVPGLSVETPGQAEAWILGPASQIYASGSLTVPVLRYQNERVRDARVAWRLHAGMLQLERITAAAVEGGRLSATGWLQLNPEPPRLYVTGRLENVNLAGLPGVPPQAKLRGTGDARFAVSGPLRDLHGGATVQLSNLVYNTARLEAATARLDYQKGILYVRSLRAADERGRLVAAGTVGRRGDLDLEVRAKGVDLAALLAPFTRQPASGTAYFVGQVEGTTRDPRLVGDLQVYAAQFGNIGADYAEGKIELRPDRVSTPQMVLRVYPGEITVSGAASGWRTGRTQANLTATVSELSLSRLLAMAETRAQVAGSLSGSLTFQGDPTRLIPPATAGRAASPPGWRAAGNIRVDDLLVSGANLGTARARLDVEGGRLRVRQASIEGEPLAATASGSVGLLAAAPRTPRQANGARGWVTSNSPLDLSFAIQRLDLAAAATRAGSRVLLQGTGRLTEGQVTGTVGRPVVTAQLEAAPITVNGVTFTRLAGSAAYARDRITLRDVALRENGGTLHVRQASIQPEPKAPINALTVDAELESFPLQRLIDLARNSASVGGRPRAQVARADLLDAQGPVSGTLTARPQGTAVGAPTLWTAALNAPAVTLAGYRIAPSPSETTPAETVPLTVGVEARATYHTQGRVSLDRLAVTRDEGRLRAHGSLVQEGGVASDGSVLPQGWIDLQVDAEEIPIGLFGPLAPALHPLVGEGELHLNAEGPLKAPVIRASMDVDQFTIAGVPFSHFAVPFIQIGEPPGGGAGAIRIENARLELDEPGAASAEHLILVDGTLPFVWQKDVPGFLPRGIVPGDEPLSLSVRLPQQGLDVFNRFANLDPKGLSPRVAPIVTTLGSLSAVSGTMSGDLAVTGTPARFDSSGSFRIENGAFQPQRGQTRFDQIAVRLDFIENRIQVQQFEGRSSDGGRFQVGGEVTGITLGVGDQPPSAQLNLTLGLNDLRYRARNITGYLQERFRGTIRTVDPRRPEEYEPLQLTGDWRTPRLAGAVQFRRTTLALPGSFPETRAAAALPIANPTFNIDLILGSDVWLEAPRMRMQLAGRLPVSGTLAAPVVRGNLLVERGTLSFPTARFRVEGAVEVAFAPGQETGAPVPLRVDLTATSRVRGADPNTGQRQRYELTLQIQGPLSADAYETASTVGAPGRPGGERLSIEATSDPPLSEPQILALLGRGSAVESVIRGGGSTEDVLRREIADTLVAWGAPTLFVPLETAIEDWLGLEEFSIDFALKEPVQLRLTKQITGPFYVTYTRSLAAFGASPTSITPGTATLNLYTLEFYYRISERLRLGYRFEEPSGNQVLLFNGTLRF